MFKEIFKEMIEYLVDRIETNYALQIIPNSLLANPTTSPTFASILLTFLLKRMENMGGVCGVCVCVCVCVCGWGWGCVEVDGWEGGWWMGMCMGICGWEGGWWMGMCMGICGWEGGW